MNIEIENPLELLLEITYLNAVISDKKVPEMINLNKIANKLMEVLKE